MKGYLVIRYLDSFSEKTGAVVLPNGYFVAAFSSKEDAFMFMNHLEDQKLTTLIETDDMEINARKPRVIPPYEVSLA